MPPGIAPAGQRLAETPAVFAADKSYDLLLLHDGDIGEIALFDQDLAIIAQKYPVVRVDGAGEEALIEAFPAAHCVFWPIRTNRKHRIAPPFTEISVLRGEGNSIASVRFCAYTAP